MKRAARPLFALTLASALVACGGKSITPKGLADIMPSAADAPFGTSVQTASLGAQTLTSFVDDPAVRAKLKSLGFRVAYTAAFATANFVNDEAAAPLGSAYYATFGVLLRDAAAAKTGFAFYAARSRARAKHLSPLLTEKELGDDSYAFHFSSLDNTPLPGVAYLWRVDNALFSVVGLGNPSPDPAIVRDLVGKIDARAKR